MTESEPEWSDEDRAEMQALALLEADTCAGCGGSLTETTAPEAEGSYRVEAWRCHRCTSIGEAALRHREHQPQAVRYRVVD